MPDLLNENLQTFLDRLADRTPTPGGGGATALNGAIACAQARMVVAYSINPKTDPSAREALEDAAGQLKRCDQMLRQLISEDAVAYENMAAVRKAARQDDRQTGDFTAAVLAAITVPMEMAAVASTALKVMDDVKSLASRYLLSDLGVAAALAHATARAARYSVRVNVREINDVQQREEHINQVNSMVEHCAAHCASIEEYVSDHL